MLKSMLRWLPIVLCAVLVLPGCGGAKKKAAESALAAAEGEYAKIAEAVKNLAPDQDTEITAAFTAAHEALAKGEIATVMQSAKDLTERIKTLAESLPGLRAQLEADWKQLGTVVPGALKALDKKLEDYGQPPAGMPGREKFDAATAALDRLSSQWDEAKKLGDAGKLAAAVQLGNAVKDEAVKVITSFQEGS